MRKRANKKIVVERKKIEVEERKLALLLAEEEAEEAEYEEKSLDLEIGNQSAEEANSIRSLSEGFDWLNTAQSPRKDSLVDWVAKGVTEDENHMCF